MKQVSCLTQFYIKPQVTALVTVGQRLSCSSLLKLKLPVSRLHRTSHTHGSSWLILNPAPTRLRTDSESHHKKHIPHTCTRTAHTREHTPIRSTNPLLKWSSAHSCGACWHPGRIYEEVLASEAFCYSNGSALVNTHSPVLEPRTKQEFNQVFQSHHIQHYFS